MESQNAKGINGHRSWLRPTSYVFTLIAALIYFGFGVFAITCCICSIYIGVNIAVWIASSSDGYFLHPLISSWLSTKAQTKLLGMSTVTCSTSRSFPWKELIVSSSVNEAVENLLDQVIDEYVSIWYKSGISHDRDFLNEVRYQFRFVCSQIVKKALALDIPTLIAEDIVPIAALHMHRIAQIERELTETAYHRSILETSICERMSDLHFCMGSRRHELDYLRQVADFLVLKLFDDSHLAGRAHEDDRALNITGKNNMSLWPSQSARHFLRELVVNAFLLPCLDLIADPDTINHLLIMAFDVHKLHDDTVTQSSNNKNELFLENFTETNKQTLPDSLLQLKLSEVLRDARQFSMFRLYLQDICGPVHELSFLAEASRIHDSMQRKTESSSQISYDIWQLFGQFVHSSAPNRIVFDDDVVQDFKAAIEHSDLPMLDKIIEKSYQIIYQRMQSEYLISFCQSDSYFGYLCGSPPVSVNELIEQRSEQKKEVVTGGTFSLAQFRSRLRRALTVVSYGGPLDNEESLDINLVDDIDGSTNGNEFLNAETENTRSRDTKESTSYLSTHIPSQLSLSSIDVPAMGRGESTSPNSCYSGTDEDDISSSSAVEQPRREPFLIIDKETRNINYWKVNVCKIIPVRETNTGKTMYAYVIDVERAEAKEKETRRWCIYRRFAEFYVLEMKLLEFHGDSLRFTMLPPKKAPFSRNRVFFEQHRLLFQLFLSSLCKQKVLQRSELLFAFLSSNEEFRYNLLLSDLNPWKVVKKMPGRLSREKGQHLRPFLLTILANTLYSQEKIEFREKYEVSELSSLSSLGVGVEDRQSCFHNPLFGNNCFGRKILDDYDYDCDRPNWTRSLLDSMCLLFFSFMSHTSQLALNVHSALIMLCRGTIDNLMIHLLRRACRMIFSEQNLVVITRLIQRAIFCSDGSLPSEQEKILREELATRLALEFIQDEMPSYVQRAVDSKCWRNGVKKLVNILQYPRLNKHLSYVILDLLIAKVFPDEFT